jgi:hypothetical protein
VLAAAARRPEELLEHELCEVVEVRTAGGGGGTSSSTSDPTSSTDASDGTTTTVILRGLRIRVGIDCSSDVHAGINPATGRMEYRGR